MKNTPIPPDYTIQLANFGVIKPAGLLMRHNHTQSTISTIMCHLHPHMVAKTP